MTVDAHVSRLFGRDSLYMILWAVQLGCAALLTPVLTRFLGTGEFGTVAAANTVMQVLFVVGGFGLQTAIQRAYAQPGGPAGARRIVTLAIVLALAVTGLALGTVAGWARPLGLTGELPALRLAIAWAGLSAITNASLGLLRSQDRLAAFALVSLVQSAMAEAASLGLVAAVRPTAENFLLGQLLLQAVAVALGLALARPRRPRRTDAPLLRGALGYALPLVPAVLGMLVLSTADRLLIQAALGPDAVARYQVAYNVASGPILLLGVLNTAWMPRFFALAEHGERTAVLAASRDLLYRLLVPLVAGVAIGAPFVLRVWAPPSYRPEDLYWVFSLIVVAAVPFAAQLALHRALVAAGHTGVVAAAVCVAAVANLLLTWALIPPLGLAGAALATVVAYGLLYLGLRRGAATTAPVPAPPRRLRALIAASVTIGLAAAAVPDTPLFLAVRGALVLGTVIWFFRVLTGVRRPSGAVTPGAASGVVVSGVPGSRAVCACAAPDACACRAGS
ncbi:O-antigen/teichoic acid export membrane protein [Catenuloplanes nepalensis]|uniref:O-antigen/teichoic acid export membrane protein n=1 Tax=Catenuloplanes nepalensis TaxID=587533 RepID=A0ABT9N815_9ACTN|nr:oligosaccharide flippase family protein [Catenuloplanes nepalensis]MDP9799650.1 O-antigen/teichoic acid export membrane protein [Catenuloplanes nepalensis]